MQTLEQLQTGQLASCTSIKLSCGLSEFPEELFELVNTLEILDLSGNQLSSLPTDFGKFTKLKIAFFSDNLFTEYPEVLAQCPLLEMVGFKANMISSISEKAISKNIRWLILTNNRISQLPKSIGNCTRLQKVALAGNQLTELPVEMGQCKNLELLRISANCINKLPTWLMTLPKLSWLAYSDNPCSNNQKNNFELNEIFWHQFELKEKLGEGASGIISKALWMNNTKCLDVAVKVFKGDVTSDGLPLSEMKSCVVSKGHKNLVKVLGKIKGHPQHKEGLVFELIPPEFKNLGNPPSYVTCTRDTYPNDTTFTLTDLIKIVIDTTSVSAHLHSKGIMHGDLYAHNIMINKDATILLGDFGAATIYEKNAEYAEALEKMDVRAFGCLLEDLLERLNLDFITHPSVSILVQLKEECLQNTILKRPSFIELYETLNGISI